MGDNTEIHQNLVTVSRCIFVMYQVMILLISKRFFGVFRGFRGFCGFSWFLRFLMVFVVSCSFSWLSRLLVVLASFVKLNVEVNTIFLSPLGEILAENTHHQQWKFVCMKPTWSTQRLGETTWWTVASCRLSPCQFHTGYNPPRIYRKSKLFTIQINSWNSREISRKTAIFPKHSRCLFILCFKSYKFNASLLSLLNTLT